MANGHFLINTIYIFYFYSTSILGVSWQDHDPYQPVLPPEKRPAGIPVFSNYFSVLNRLFCV